MSGTKFTTTARTPAATTKFAAELADGSKGHVLHSALVITGSWTPVITFATPGDLNVVYGSGGQTGSWAKIGNLVRLTFSLYTTTFTHTAASGALRVTGSPHTTRNVATERHSGALVWAGITKASYSSVCTAMNENSAIIEFVGSGSGQAISGIAVADVPTGGGIVLRGNIEFLTD